MSTIFTYLADFGKMIFGYTPASGSHVDGIWEMVIDFITTGSNYICLIPLVAWLFVLGVSSVRKMYKG